jgi:dihydropyrimidinase
LVLTAAIAQAQPATETLIRGGDVFVDDGLRAADVRIVGSTITEVGSGLEPRDANTQVLDADGLLVLPGGIDPHVHIGRVDDYASGSRAALAGGITTISNFGGVRDGETPAQALQRARPDIDAQSIADVIFHPIVSDPAGANAETLEALAAAGQTTVKVFMVRPSFDQAVPGFMATLRAARDTGILMMIHAEDAGIVQNTAAQFIAEGRGSLAHFADARPVAAEVAATQRAVAMAEATGAPTYIVHLSSERALRVAEEAQARGLPVYVETRPIYLHLTRERFEGETPGLYVGQPPLRSRDDLDALWDGIARGTVHVVATDHVAYTREEKLDPGQDVARHRAGMSNLQVMLPMLFSDGVGAGRISLDRFVEVTSTNPAKLFGLYPRKGVVAVGSDADLALWDPDETRTIRDEDMFSGSGYSVHAGRVVTGWPTLTMRRGEIVYRDGEIRGEAGSGQLVPRSRWKPPGP